MASLDEPIPGYKLIERIGRGGFGEVWKCEAPGGFHKAIKFVYGDLESLGDDGRTAEQELKALHRVKGIRHPFILSLERFDIVDGQLIIIMELADRNLWDRFRECREKGQVGIPRGELLSYMAEAAEALDLMNVEHQIQHLDIKPQNLFLIGKHIKVADFGLAKAFEGMQATVTGGVTPVYAAPETFDDRVTRFTDQYSLAVVYQELLTGTRPFSGTNARQLVIQHLNGAPDTDPLPDADRDAVERALCKMPDQRFPLCSDFVDALRSGDGSSGTTSRFLSGPRPEEIQTPASSRTFDHREAGVVLSPSLPKHETLAESPKQAGRPAGKRPLPALATQRQIISTSKLGASLKAEQAEAKSASEPKAERVTAPPELTGAGVLRPALVIGLGQTGLLSLQQFRAAAHERFGPRAELPHRELYIDTDADAARRATAAAPPLALPQGRVIAAPLQRPAHYERKDGLPPVEKWLKGRLLYQLPRTPNTGGRRAFGRLALCDHYRPILGRLRADLRDLARPDLLDAADRQTELGLWTNQPRVYVVASLGGATGGGMFIDLAYIIRRELKLIGYARPEVVGVLFLPPLEKQTGQSRAGLNCHAALSELAHFGHEETFFHFRFDAKDEPVSDRRPPFDWCYLVPHSRSEEPKRQRRAADRAALIVSQDLHTRLGREIDGNRPPPGKACVPARSVGLHRLTWPRARLLYSAVRRFGTRLMQGWLADRAEALAGPVGEWAAGEWDRRGLGVESILREVRTLADEAHGSPVESSLRVRARDAAAGGGSRALYDAFDEAVDLLGIPDGADEGKGGTMPGRLMERVRGLIRRAENDIKQMALHLIDEPGRRVAAAEAALDRFQALSRDAITALEQMARQVDGQVRDALRRLLPLANAVTAGQGEVGPEVAAAVAEFPTLRHRSLILAAALAFYRALKGGAPEYARDVNFARMRLAELARSLRDGLGSDAKPSRGASAYVLPAGCSTLDEAAYAVLDGLTEADYEEFDAHLQAQIRRQFRSLAEVCQAANDHWPALRGLIEEAAQGFLEERVGRADAAEVFLGRYDDAQAAQRGVTDILEEATPWFLGPRSGSEVVTLAAPPGAAGDELIRLAADAAPDLKQRVVRAAGDVVVHREVQEFRLSDLPQMGQRVRDLYLKAAGDDVETPHARTDIDWLKPLD